MTRRTLVIAALAAAVALAPLATAVAQQSGSIFIPLLVYRTGAYAPSGIPNANGFQDYFNLLNERDGGINGVKITVEECETQYDTKQGVECYERLKGKGTVLVNPYSTGITYQLIPKAPGDKVVVHSMGYGMTASADGRWFPWVFNFPMTYWSQASAFIKYVGAQEGGLDKLKGKKIVHIFHNSPYGKEANPTLETLAKTHQFELTLLAVDHPGQEQKATWLQIRRINPDWIYLSGWGVMNGVAVKEAAGIGYKMDRLVGNWWSGSESDVIPAGDGAKGYKSMTFHAPGAGFRVHQDLVKHVYAKGKGAAKLETLGEVYHNRGMINAMLNAEAVRTAMVKYSLKTTPNGEQVRWGFENLNLTEAQLDKLGMKGMLRPLRVTCENHEGLNGMAAVQQWDGKAWKVVSDWIEPMRDVVRPKLEEAAKQEGGEKLKYTMRDCAKEK